MTESEGSPLLKGSTERSAFISYSWTSEQHREWVLKLAERLVNHGVYVVLDRWQLKPGQDKYAFMERMVTDPDIRKVLIICDRRYQENADKRKGGVGDETLLITSEVYGRVNQEKFIPIVVERDENGDPYMPRYLAARMFIDMSIPAKFEDKYQELLRNLYDVPETAPPPLGEPPAYIAGEEVSTPKAASIVAAAPARTITEQEIANFITNFFEPLLVDLDDFRFKPIPDEPYDDTITRLIEQMGPLKDAFVAMAKRLSQSELRQADLDRLHDYLEKVAQFQFRPFNVPEYREIDWDNYRFICYELVLYLIATLLDQGKHADVAALVRSTYFYDSNTVRQTHTGIDLFNHYIGSLDGMRNSRLGLRRVSVTADMIKERAEGTGISFDSLLSTDLLLHYLTFLQVDAKVDLWQSRIWFPYLSPYATYYESIPILQKLVSARHFERVKVLFSVDTPNQLRQIIEQAAEEKSRYYEGNIGFQFAIPRLTDAVPLDQLASVP